MRHAQAAAAIDDPDRGLSAQGYREIEAILTRLPESVKNISYIFHSGVKRTQQTAECVAGAIEASKVMSMPQSLGESSDVAGCLSDINAWESDTLLVSHYPFLTELVTRLVTDGALSKPIVHFATATLVCLEKSSTGWVIAWMIAP